MLVKIKRLSRGINWGIKDASGKILPKYENCSDKYVPGLDSVTGRLKTGLTDAEARIMEKKLYLPEGELSPKSPFWYSFMIIIPSQGLELNTEEPEDELKYKILLADPTVAKNQKEAKSLPNAEFVLFSEENEAKEDNRRRSVIATAYAHFSKMTETEIIDALHMLGKRADETDPEIAKNVLGKIVEETPKKFLEAVGDKNFKKKVWILRMIRSGILRKTGMGDGSNMPIYYEDILLGNGPDEVIRYLEDPEHQNVYVELKKKTDSSKVGKGKKSKEEEVGQVTDVTEISEDI